MLLATSFSQTWGWDGYTQEDINNTEDKILCLQPAVMPPSTAAKVLCAIAQARVSLNETKFADAANTLHHAQTLIDLIKYAGLTTRVKDQLWEVKKNFDYESPRQINLDLIPLDLASQTSNIFFLWSKRRSILMPHTKVSATKTRCLQKNISRP